MPRATVPRAVPLFSICLPKHHSMATFMRTATRTGRAPLIGGTNMDVYCLTCSCGPSRHPRRLLTFRSPCQRAQRLQGTTDDDGVTTWQGCIGCRYRNSLTHICCGRKRADIVAPLPNAPWRHTLQEFWRDCSLDEISGDHQQADALI